MNKFVSGKASLLVLSAVFVVASFLLGQSLTSVLATGQINDDECGQITEYKTEGVYWDVEDNINDSRVYIDVHFSPGNGKLISVQAKSGYEIVSTELKVEDDENSGYINYGEGDKDHFDPEGGDIQEYKVNVRKVCEEEPVDVCENLDGDQAALPDGMEDDGEGFCSCKEGYHEVNSEGQRVAEDGLNNFSCVADDPTPTPYDACFNLEGTQSGIPDGYHKDTEDGACNQYQLGGAPPPSDSGAVLGDSTGKVLGASTMAGTGSFAENLYIAIMGLGGIITTAGFKSFRKASK